MVFLSANLSILDVHMKVKMNCSSCALEIGSPLLKKILRKKCTKTFFTSSCSRHVRIPLPYDPLLKMPSLSRKYLTPFTVLYLYKNQIRTKILPHLNESYSMFTTQLLQSSKSLTGSRGRKVYSLTCSFYPTDASTQAYRYFNRKC